MMLMFSPRRLCCLTWWLVAATMQIMTTPICHAGIPTHPEYFPLQFVDHNLGQQQQKRRNHSSSRATQLRNQSNNDNTTSTMETSGVFWKQRFYRNSQHFRGPGYPILLIMGGEWPVSPSTGIKYPIVVELYAKAFGALVLLPEHRFYGESQPISMTQRRKQHPDPRVTLLTAEQALKDAVRLTRFVQRYYGCALADEDRSSPRYCPVISIGGSYAGFLSAMARFRFPQVVDMGYAASAPIKFYAQQVDQYAYYHLITQVAETSVKGCSVAVKETLEAFVKHVAPLRERDDLIQVATEELGVCPGTVPDYLLQDASTFIDEMVMLAGYTFANLNMAHYPPSNETDLSRSCFIFLSSLSNRLERLRTFFVQSLASASYSESSAPCFDLTSQLPGGPNATLSGGDWSGVGSGTSGESWDFETCTLLVETIGFGGGNSDMFPPRTWSLDWLTKHCQARFGVTPQPHQLVQDWGFDELPSKTSHILFTNGLNDGWSVSGIQQNLSDTLVAMNFPNGAHHSDLREQYAPSSPSLGVDDNEDDKNKDINVEDTSDISDGIRRIQNLLAAWLNELPSYRIQNKSAALAR